ncbi:MAG: AAA family ATPase [Syntrophomonadaceae bacterium]|nr:AAA family ATPase [Syntrophomonadaceae bacterium]MDD3023887.1 AAA family ATPase [Syntrophomonadaceae bacterium]
MTVSISLINMKGGVGKTTLTIALAEFMAIEHGLRVLVIDLDPQSNASACLMDLEQWKRQNMRGQTVMRLFLDSFKDWPVFSPREAVVKNASNIGGGIEGLDLMPSGTELMDLQDSLMTIYSEQEDRSPLIYLLRDAIGNILQDYDMVLIDCPPSLGLITQNGLAISDYYLIPVIPETMSIHGIPQIVTRVNRFKKQTGSSLEPMGVVATRYRQQNPEHFLNLSDLRAGAQKKGYRRLFETIIHESTPAANAVNFRRQAAKLREKYASPRPFNEYRELSREVLNHVGK